MRYIIYVEQNPGPYFKIIDQLFINTKMLNYLMFCSLTASKTYTQHTAHLDNVGTIPG